MKHDFSQATPTRGFVILSATTALLTLGLIVFGAVVRVTDSGLGCGNEWPLCNGTIFPPLDNITAWIEWLHRLFALLIGVMGLATLYLAWRNYRHYQSNVLKVTIIAAVLFALQSGLGAMVVVFDLPPTFVTLHLGVAMLLLGALLLASVLARYQPKLSYSRDSVTTLLYINTGFSLLIILTGALVRGSGATLACTEWPACNNGNLFPFEQGQLAIIHMLHRFSVVALGINLLLLVWQIWKTRQHSLLRRLTMLVGFVYLLQSGVGAMFVTSVAGPEWGAAHVGLASVTWALLVMISAIETLNLQANDQRETQAWQAQPESTLT